MKRARHAASVACATLLLLAVSGFGRAPGAAAQQNSHLYVAVPGSLLLFDIDKGHKFVRRISLSAALQPRGIAAHAKTRRLYLTTVERILAIDLATERVVWEKSYDGHCCDRLDVSPDGQTIYAPAFERPRWYVINAANGDLITSIDVMGWPRQTIYSLDGKQTYLSAWESKVILVADAKTHKVIREVGPFTDFVCPFTINRRATLAFANVDRLVGFEVADLHTGLALDRVIVGGSDADAWPRYECPSHGIALTPDESELWIADGVDDRLHIFDAKTYPPVAVHTIQLRGQPRWITFSRDGRYAYAATQAIDRETRTVVATLEDEHGIPVRSDLMAEID